MPKVDSITSPPQGKPNKPHPLKVPNLENPSRLGYATLGSVSHPTREIRQNPCSSPDRHLELRGTCHDLDSRVHRRFDTRMPRIRCFGGGLAAMARAEARRQHGRESGALEGQG